MDLCVPASWASDDLFDIFKGICRSGHQVFCVVDAVDEAESTDVVQLLKSAASSEQSSRTKLIILSRPNAEIERQVIDHPCIVLEDENVNDIKRVVQLGLESLQRVIHSLNFPASSVPMPPGMSRQSMRHCRLRQPRCQPLANAATREKNAIDHIRKELLAKAQGSILWVKLVIDKLTQEAESNQCSSLQELRGFVDVVPQELTEYYKQIARDLTDCRWPNRSHEARRVLMWICAAGGVSEVTLGSLWEAMALLRVSFGSKSLDEVWDQQVSINSYDELWRKIYSACGPFIEIFNPGLSAEESRVYHYGPSSILQLMHQSVRDFLCDPDAAGALYFRIEEATDLVKHHLVHYLGLFVSDSARLRAEGPQDSRLMVDWFNELRLFEVAVGEAKAGNWPILRNVLASCWWELQSPLDKCECILQNLLSQPSSLREGFWHLGDRTNLVDLGRLFYRACADGLVTAVHTMLCFGWPGHSASARLALAGIIFAATRCQGEKVKMGPARPTRPERIQIVPVVPEKPKETIPPRPSPHSLAPNYYSPFLPPILPSPISTSVPAIAPIYRMGTATPNRSITESPWPSRSDSQLPSVFQPYMSSSAGFGLPPSTLPTLPGIVTPNWQVTPFISGSQSTPAFMPFLQPSIRSQTPQPFMEDPSFSRRKSPPTQIHLRSDLPTSSDQSDRGGFSSGLEDSTSQTRSKFSVVRKRPRYDDTQLATADARPKNKRVRREFGSTWVDYGWTLELSTHRHRRKSHVLGVPSWCPFLDYVSGSKARVLEQVRATNFATSIPRTGSSLERFEDHLAPIEDVEEAIALALESKRFSDFLSRSIDM